MTHPPEVPQERQVVTWYSSRDTAVEIQDERKTPPDREQREQREWARVLHDPSASRFLHLVKLEAIHRSFTRSESAPSYKRAEWLLLAATLRHRR